MLVLSRKLNESIIIDGDIRITIVGIRGNHVRVGIEAPGSVPILREELCGCLESRVSVEESTPEAIGDGQAAGLRH